MAFLVCHTVEEWASHFGDAIRSAVTVGNFDGLHIGHQKILRAVRERASATGERAAVITFDPHPMRVLHPERAPVMIQTLAQRLAGFEQMGLDAALVLRFDLALSKMSPEEFIEKIVVRGLRTGAILVGSNFRFGHRGAGDVRLLGEFGKRDGFDVETVPPVEVGGQVVSSTAIRAAVAGGNVAEAIPLLGRPFSLTGEIHAGAGRGRTILFPTLNLAPEQELLPKLGVYATESVVGDRAYASVTNVGTRPTFNGAGVTVESHLFEFKDSMNNGRMKVKFYWRIRNEQKFPGVDALRAQIARDIEAARRFFAERALAGNYSGH